MASANRLVIKKIPGIPQIIPILAILMEVSWVYAWLVWLSKISVLEWPGTPLNLLSCMLLALFTELAAYLSLAKKWSLRRVRFVVLPASLIVMLALIRLNSGGGYEIGDGQWFSYAGSNLWFIITGILFGTYFIWRGITVGSSHNSFSDLYKRFLGGLTGIIVLLILWGMTGNQRENIWSNAGIYTVTFFGVGLFTLALANLEKFRTELLLHQESGSSFSRQWLPMLIVLVLAILGISLAVTSIFSSDLLGTFLNFLNNLADWILTGLIYALYPVALVVSLVYYLIKFLMSLVHNEPPPPPPQDNGPNEWQKMMQGQGQTALPTALVMVLKWGSITLVVVLVIYFLARALMRYSQRRAEPEVEEIQESMGSWNVFSADLRAILAWLFRWTKRRRITKSEISASEALSVINSESPDRIFSIRELYRAWLWQEYQSGIPRRKSETPYEYRRRLYPLRKEMTKEIEAITEAYVTERYGETTQQPDGLRRLNGLWRALRDKLKALNNKAV